MKKNLLVLLCASLCTAATYAQSCIVVTSSSFSNPSADGTTWNLNIAYTANGNKALEIKVYCGSTLILDSCFITNGSGSATFSGLQCTNGFNLLNAVFVPHTGNCTSAACGPDVILPPSGGPLPVRMSAFYARRKSSSVSLSWQTSLEVNAKEFVIERKSGNSFIEVGKVAADNKPNGSSYTFTDMNASKSVSQYRLKMLDQDRAFSYSEIRAVKGAGVADDFTIFPNPSRGDARISITDISGPTDVQLVDNYGRTLKVVSMNNSNTADFYNLQKGMYLVRIINKTSGETLTKKLNVVD